MDHYYQQDNKCKVLLILAVAIVFISLLLQLLQLSLFNVANGNNLSGCSLLEVVFSKQSPTHVFSASAFFFWNGNDFADQNPA